MLRIACAVVQKGRILSLDVVGEIYLIGFFFLPRVQMSSSKFLIHFVFFAVFLTAVNSGKNPRSDGSVIFYEDDWTFNLSYVSAYRGFGSLYLFVHKCSCLLQRVKSKLLRF